MGKRKDFDASSSSVTFMSSPSGSSSQKRHHHKKHKKHKKTKVEYDSDAVDVVNDVSVTSIPEISATDISDAEKLKQTSNVSNKTITSSPAQNSSATKSLKRKKGRGKDSGTSSDEERWLDAIESGKLDEVDEELRKIKDPKLMTARQRAMYDKEPSPGGEILMSLPTGYKEKVMTAEAIQKAQLKSQRRKQMADEKREKDKKKTMERLLKKQESKSGKHPKSKLTKTVEPLITYKQNLEEATVSVPIGHKFPLAAKRQFPLPKTILCAMDGCTNKKIYNCSKTNVPLCSFRCYKRNVATLKAIIC